MFAARPTCHQKAAFACVDFSLQALSLPNKREEGDAGKGLSDQTHHFVGSVQGQTENLALHYPWTDGPAISNVHVLSQLNRY